MGQVATLSRVDDRDIQFRAAVGQRIQECARHRGFATPAALHARILQELIKRNPKDSLSRQAVSNWWHGKIIPSWDTLPALAIVLGVEQEWILFGSKRNEQLRKEKQYLARVSEDELALLTKYREASKSGQRIIAKVTHEVAEEHPAPDASIHPLRRREDKVKG